MLVKNDIGIFSIYVSHHRTEHFMDKSESHWPALQVFFYCKTLFIWLLSIIYYVVGTNLHNAIHEASGAQILQASESDCGVRANKASLTEAPQRHSFVAVWQPWHKWYTYAKWSDWKLGKKISIVLPKKGYTYNRFTNFMNFQFFYVLTIKCSNL